MSKLTFNIYWIVILHVLASVLSFLCIGHVFGIVISIISFISLTYIFIVSNISKNKFKENQNEKQNKTTSI